MRLRNQYIVYLIIIHLTLMGISYFLFKDKVWVFLIVEVLIFVSIWYALKLYKKLIKPIQLMQSGSSAILDNDFSIKYVETGSHDLDSLIRVYNTMIDRLRIERTRLQEQSYFLEKLIEVSPIGMIILDYDQIVTEINPAAFKIIEKNKEIIGKDFNMLKGDMVYKIQNISLNDSKIITGKGLSKYKCSVNHVVHLGFPRKFIMIEDLSTELLKNEKDAYGKVIRMMAHEVNNSMGAINSILKTVTDYGFEGIDEDEDIKESLEIAIERNNNLATFVGNFASIIRLPKPDLKLCDLNDILNKTSQIWTNKAKEKGIEIKLNLVDNLHVKIDPILFEQACSNIIKNAIEAIGENGLIQIESQLTPPKLRIIDNGAGIDESDQEHLFTPFFSTKTNGQGIGLMIIREILVNHKASFTLNTDKESSLTTFEISF